MSDDPKPDDGAVFALLTENLRPTLPTLFGELMAGRTEDGDKDFKLLAKLTRVEALGLIVTLANGFEQMFQVALIERTGHARHHGETPETKAELWGIALEGVSSHAEAIASQRSVEKMLADIEGDSDAE